MISLSDCEWRVASQWDGEPCSVHASWCLGDDIRVDVFVPFVDLHICVSPPPGCTPFIFEIERSGSGRRTGHEVVQIESIDPRAICVVAKRSLLPEPRVPCSARPSDPPCPIPGRTGRGDLRDCAGLHYRGSPASRSAIHRSCLVASLPPGELRLLVAQRATRCWRPGVKKM